MVAKYFVLFFGFPLLECLSFCLLNRNSQNLPVLLLGI